MKGMRNAAEIAVHQAAVASPPKESAPAVESGKLGNEEETAVGQEGDSLESLDSLYSKKSMEESLDTLPSFSPKLSPLKASAKKMSWRKSNTGSSGTSVSSGVNDDDTASMASSTAGGKSRSFRMPSKKKLFSTSPKKMIKKLSGSPEKKGNKPVDQVPKTPSAPPSTISNQPAQVLSPLTPVPTAMNGGAMADKDSTPIMDNGSSPTSNDSEFERFLQVVKSPSKVDLEAVEQPIEENEQIEREEVAAGAITSETEPVKEDETGEDESVSASSTADNDDCRCFWCPGFLRGSAKNQSAVVVPLE